MTPPNDAPNPESAAVQRSPRAPRKKPRPVRRFIMLNIIPLAALSALGLLWYQGKIDLEALPAGANENLVGAVICIGLLFVVASLSLPAAHAVVKGADASFQRRSQVLAGNEEGSRVGSAFATPILAAVYVVAWPTRFVLILLSLGLLAATILFTVRMVEPTFMQPLVDRIQELRAQTGA